MRRCKKCNFTCETVSALGNHNRWKHKSKNLEKLCSVCLKLFDPCGFEKHFKLCSYQQKCKGCEVILPKKQRSLKTDKFCSKSCATSFNNKAGTTGYTVYRKNRGIKSNLEHYRAICFTHWDKECAICKWNISVDVHHIDGNHYNDSSINLIPLCQNHHQMTRMNEYRFELKEKFEILIKEKFTLS